MFATVFLLVNMQYAINSPDEIIGTAYRTRAICEAKIQDLKEEADGSSAKSHAAGYKCIPYKLK